MLKEREKYLATDTLNKKYSTIATNFVNYRDAITDWWSTFFCATL